MNPKKVTKKDLNDFYTAYSWLDLHPIFQYAMDKNLGIEFVKVNPKNNKISNNAKKNTKIQCWLEPTVYTKVSKEESVILKVPHKTYYPMGDFDLAVAGDSFEEAIVKLAKKVFKYYGTYTKKESEIAELIPTYGTKKEAKKKHKEFQDKLDKIFKSKAKVKNIS